jgi:platelet-activating factor acetylhydrolase
MVFSHGLVGFRNAYSHIGGLLASHGVCVIAPDHRDSSSPVTYVRETDAAPAKTIHYIKHDHNPTPETYDARDAQLRIRMWELGCIFNALLKIDLGTAPRNLDPNFAYNGERTDVISMFKNTLNVHEPGSIIWAGHSFGGATTYQFLKSTYHALPETMPEGQSTLFTPARDSDLVKQITSQSIALLLDMWCMPLRSPATKWLWDLEMPAYDTSSSNPAGGNALLALLSEAFTAWEGNMADMKRALLPKAGVPVDNTEIRSEPYMFYVAASAHHSQSDFGIMFPLLSNRMYKAKEPHRILELNARAMLQILRINGMGVSEPTEAEMEMEGAGVKRKRDDEVDEEQEERPTKLVKGDAEILKKVSTVRDWHTIDATDVPDEDDVVSTAEDMKAAGVGIEGRGSGRPVLLSGTSTAVGSEENLCRSKVGDKYLNEVSLLNSLPADGVSVEA